MKRPTSYRRHADSCARCVFSGFAKEYPPGMPRVLLCFFDDDEGPEMNALRERVFSSAYAPEAIVRPDSTCDEWKD